MDVPAMHNSQVPMSLHLLHRSFHLRTEASGYLGSIFALRARLSLYTLQIQLPLPYQPSPTLTILE